MYLVSDDKPMTRSEILNAAVSSGRFPTEIVATEDFCTSSILNQRKNGKRLNGSKTRASLRWKPLYTDFVSYISGPDDR